MKFKHVSRNKLTDEYINYSWENLSGEAAVIWFYLATTDLGWKNKEGIFELSDNFFYELRSNFVTQERANKILPELERKGYLKLVVDTYEILYRDCQINVAKEYKGIEDASIEELYSIEFEDFNRIKSKLSYVEFIIWKYVRSKGVSTKKDILKNIDHFSEKEKKAALKRVIKSGYLHKVDKFKYVAFE